MASSQTDGTKLQLLILLFRILVTLMLDVVLFHVALKQIFRDALTIVFNKYSQDVAFLAREILCIDMYGAAMVGRLDGILQNVEEYLLHRLSVYAKDEIFVDFDLYLESLGIYLVLEELLDTIELLKDGSTLKDWIE